MIEGLSVAYVLMPEKGLFLVCLPEGYDSPAGTRCLVQLDYGEDVGIVKMAQTYDPNVHGARIPGFHLIRPLRAEDEARLAANASLAESMCVTFMRLAAKEGHTIRIVHRRLSFGRARLFVRFLSEEIRPDLAYPYSELRRLFNVTVNAWQLGPRDRVSLQGAIGICGRTCCCSTWQTHYPQGLSGDRVRALATEATIPNGICGRYKCCLAFEEKN